MAVRVTHIERDWRHLAAAMVLAFACALVAVSPALAATKAPTLVSLSTRAAAPGSTVTLTGTGFGAATSTSLVTFNGIKARTVSWSDTSIAAVVPSKTVAGYVGVTVGNQTSNGLWFAPTARPVVTAVTPSVAAPGSVVTILGSGFGSVQRTGRVTFGGVSGTVRFWSDNSIRVIVPKMTSAAYVGVWQSGAPSNGLLFDPILPPKITGVSKPRAVRGDVVTVTGTNFGSSQGSARLTLGGTELTPSKWSSSKITFTMPEGVEGGYLGVRRGSGYSNGVWLGVGGRISSLYCAASGASWYGPVGSELTIAGTGFGSAKGRVTLAGSECRVTSWSDDKVTVEVPADGMEGYVGVWRGTTASNGVWFWSQEAAHVEYVSPAVAAPGDTVEICGGGFGDKRPSNRVRLNGVTFDVVSWTDYEIRATVPAGATTGYVGVWKRGIASNGKLLTITER